MTPHGPRRRWTATRPAARRGRRRCRRGRRRRRSPPGRAPSSRDQAGEERRVGLGDAPGGGGGDEVARGDEPGHRLGRARRLVAGDPHPQPGGAQAGQRVARRPGRRRRAPRGAGRRASSRSASAAGGRSPGRSSCSASTCGWRPATVAPMAANSSWRLAPIQSAQTPHARSSLRSVSPKSKTAARSFTAPAAPRAWRRRRARRPRRSSASGRRRRSRTCPVVVLDRSTSIRTAAIRSPSSTTAARPSAVNAGRPRRGSSAHSAAPRAAGPATPAAARAQSTTRAGPARTIVDTGIACGSPAPVDSVATVPSGQSGSTPGAERYRRRASAPAGGWRRSSCSSVAVLDRARADVAVDAGVEAAVRLAGAAGRRGDQRVALRAQALAALERRLAARRACGGGGERGERGRRTGSANSCSASPGCVVCSTSSSRRALDHSAWKASPGSAALGRARPAPRPRARAPARGCAPPRSAPRAASAAGRRAGRGGSSAPWAPACGG